jgi:hypothetical protein
MFVSNRNKRKAVEEDLSFYESTDYDDYDQLSDSDEESSLFVDSIHEIDFEEGIISSNSLLAIIREVKEGMIAKLGEIRNYYTRSRRKHLRTNPIEYRASIESYLDNRNEILEEVFEQTFNDFGISRIDFEQALSLHSDNP